jgi:hypothetical protein
MEFMEKTHAGEFLVSEAAGNRSREGVTVASGAALEAATVLGKRTKSNVATQADPGNTGDGTFAATPAVGAKAEAGDYTLICIAAAADSGTFEALTPSGYRLPDVTVGQAYASDHLNFTLNDGANDFVLGDTITVTVSGDDKVVRIDPAAVDGTQEAFGVLFDRVDATAADKPGVAIVRDAEVNGREIGWPDGIADADKAAAIADLAAQGILVRDAI